MYMRHDTLFGRPNGRIADDGRRLAQDDRPSGFGTSAKSAFIRAKKLERNYGAQLRKIARHIGDIVKEFPQGTVEAALLIRTAMERYSKLLEPWAEAVGRRMVTEAAQRDEVSWRRASANIGRALADEIKFAPTGTAMQGLMAEQVNLITSLPIEAAERVHRMTMEGISQGERAATIAEKIMETGEVTRSRATLIARTEMARTSSILTQVRAQHIGCTHYIWRTAKDRSVRSSHRRLEGKVIAYAEPPECDPGHRAHAGQIWNCFPGSTEVSLTNGCHHLWRRWYEGRLIVIEHEDGLLELTPNHPVLTGRGWVAADDIQAGDYVIQSLRDRRFALQDNENEGQPTFCELFSALEFMLDRETHSGLLFDFHGDIPDDHVDTIVADYVLPGYGVSKPFQTARDRALARANRTEGVQWVEGGLLEVCETGGSCRSDELTPSFGAHGLHSPHVGLASCAALDAVTFQHSSDEQPRALYPKRYAEFAFTRNVSVDNVALRKVGSSVVARGHAPGDFDTTSAQALADQIGIIADHGGGVFDSGSGKYKTLSVVDKRVRQFSDHVYTMQTANGWFPVTSSAIITKNCRCYAEPVIPE